MPAPFIPKVITANDLKQGDVIYLTATDLWTRNLSQAEIVYDDTAAQTRLSVAAQHSAQIVGAYLADVTPCDSGPEPRHFREEFRRPQQRTFI